MIKRFRAWDAEGGQYWYSEESLLFVSGAKALELRLAPFELKDVDQFIGKLDSKGCMIYENDLINMIMPKGSKIYQVIWSDKSCGFRKVPHGMPMTEKKIDEAFMEVIGTINSKKGKRYE